MQRTVVDDEIDNFLLGETDAESKTRKCEVVATLGLVTEVLPLPEPSLSKGICCKQRRDIRARPLNVGEGYAAMPKRVWMNWRCPTTSPLASHRIWPFRITCIAS